MPPHPLPPPPPNGPPKGGVRQPGATALVHREKWLSRQAFFSPFQKALAGGRGAERHIGEAGRSVCGRECRSWVAGPIIYRTSARRVAQFARGSAGPGSPAPLFTALARGGALSLREAGPAPPDGWLSLREGVPVLGHRTHYLRRFRKAVVSVREGQCRSWVAGPIIYGTSGEVPGGAGRGRQRTEKTRHFGKMRRHFLDSVEYFAGKWHDSSMTPAPRRRTS